MFRYMTAGESHGKGIAAMIEGVPAGFTLDETQINSELFRRQGGYGRGGRQQIEKDTVEILTGIYRGKSMGSPILLWVKNRDYKIETMPELTRPRPGHADLTGAVKYRSGIRPILERASARETAGRVAAGALAAQFLRAFGIEVVGFVDSVGPLSLDPGENVKTSETPESLIQRRDASVFYSLTPERDEEAKSLVNHCAEMGDTLGGVVEVRAWGLPMGLGSHAEWTRKLDARLSAAAMSVQAIKGIEVGIGFDAACRCGSEVHDEIRFAPNAPKDEKGIPQRFAHPTNRAGGIEGGMSNGEPIILRAAMKPIATLKKPLESIDLATGETVSASYERSDVCAISATSVVLQNVVAFELAAALFEKLGGDSLAEMTERFERLE